MEFLTLNNQLVAHLAPDQKQDNFIILNIIQHADVADAQLVLGKRIGSQAFDRL